MNLSALILTSVLATGGDPCATPCVLSAPSCGCDSSPGFFTKLRAKLGSRSSCDTACIPCGTPLFAGFTTACHEPADPCGKPGLLTRLKAKFQRGGTAGCGSASDCSSPAMPCAAMPAAPSGCALPIVPTPVSTINPEPPQAMPMPPQVMPPQIVPQPVAPQPPKAMPKPIATPAKPATEITIPKPANEITIPKPATKVAPKPILEAAPKPKAKKLETGTEFIIPAIPAVK